MELTMPPGSRKAFLALAMLAIGSFWVSPVGANETPQQTSGAGSYHLPDVGKGPGADEATYNWLKSLTPREQAIFWEGLLTGFPPAIDHCYWDHKEEAFAAIMKHMETLVEDEGVSGNTIHPKMFYGKLMIKICGEPYK
ncbi:hypothetical protein [Alcanivorax sp.]|uniref:hypothetical protein n=1 Tax=Alcanivorax sp. TaxID=1872427 RepID=UPI00258B71A6|nr:hypothetical protein [Alcanivorax sp.]